MAKWFGLTHKHVHAIKHHWLTLSFFWGFCLDNLTLLRPDKPYDIIVLATYVVISMVGILVLYAATAGKLPERINDHAREYAPIVIQFVFGGLLSGMLIFYGRSADWFVSWPYMLIILTVVAGNELTKDRVKRLVFSLAMMFVGLFSFVVLMVPVLTGFMGDWIFFGSGLLAFIIMLLFVRLLYRVIPRFMGMHMRIVLFTITMLYLTLNFFYFTNIIPPVPLNLKEIGIYDSVVHFDDGSYKLTYEKQPWWKFWQQSDTTFRYTSGSTAYCFASVFAPTKLATDIYHRWQYYDDTKKTWVDYARLSYHISGGRGGGFRGYTLITGLHTGTWRCRVETKRGQVLGSDTFAVVNGPKGELTTRTEELAPQNGPSLLERFGL